MPKKRQPPKTGDLRKLQPKLRMIAGASSAVNAVRAMRSSSIATESETAARGFSGETHAPLLRGAEFDDFDPQTRLASDVIANVFVHTVDPHDPRKPPLEHIQHPYGKERILTGMVRLSELPALASDPAVSHVELGEPIQQPRPNVTDARPAAPTPARWRFGNPHEHHYGEGTVLIGIIDVQGFDFSHADFRDAKGGTRFVRIWDQGGEGKTPKQRLRGRTVKGARHTGTAFDYGAELRKSDLDAAIRAAVKLKVPAHRIEQQSQTVEGSHGTHVASIAAGKHGICKKAPIAAVLLDLPKEDLARGRSLYDSIRLVHAFDYLIAVAEEMGLPVSINISLGTNGHAHDASSSVNRWIDSALGVPRRFVAVAAGNSGQEAAEFNGDRGYVIGRIHTSGQVAAEGLTRDLEWIVVGNGISDVSENELELWYSGEDRIAISIRTPDGEVIGPVEPGQYIQNSPLRSQSLVSIYNEVYHPANGSNYIALYLSPRFTRSGIVGVPEGTWMVRLHGRQIRDGRFHGWIERDDPRPIGRSATQALWNFPSFFSERSNVDDSSVGSLGCGRWVMAVANLDESRERIHITSSQGPTRDGRCKPEIAAPGTNIVAAKGFAGDDEWIAMTGTSMASPFVTGVAGLMLAKNPHLTAAQICGIMQATARPLPGGKYAWVNDAGFGAIDPNACLREAGTVNLRSKIDTSARPRKTRKPR